VARERRAFGPINVVISMDAVLAVRSAARMSRDGISDDYEGYRHKGREYEDLARRRGSEIAELDDLLAQLGDTDDRERLVSGEYETLHGVAGDVLLEEVPPARRCGRCLLATRGTDQRHRPPDRCCPRPA
jgi:hypothetical protein